MPITTMDFGLNAPGLISGSIGRALLGGQQVMKAVEQQAAIEEAEQIRQLGEQAAIGDPIGRQQAFARMAIQFPERFEAVSKSLGLDTQQKKDEAADFAFRLQSTPFEMRNQLINERVAKLESEGRNPSDTKSLIGLSQDQQDQALEVVQMLAVKPSERMRRAGEEGLPADVRGFMELAKTAGLSKEDKQKAAMIKLGLTPRATGSAIQTISERGIAEQIGKAEATIQQRKKFGEMSGTSRAKAIDDGFERIVKIDEGLQNLDRAINLVNEGAGVGALQRFLPSFRAASVELDQLRNQLALDVIGGVTLGAISEGELDLVKQVALPTGLDGPELIEHLQARKAAQEKLRAYFTEQIDFLDKGGTVAGFLREKERQLQQQGTRPNVQQQMQQAQPSQAQRVGRFIVEVE